MEIFHLTNMCMLLTQFFFCLVFDNPFHITANARGGQQILIEVPNRGRMRVEVPRGVRPGQNFRFRVPN